MFSGDPGVSEHTEVRGPNNTPPKVKNSKPDIITIFFGHPVVEINANKNNIHSTTSVLYL